jgi:cytochrome c biogenesis factor
MHKVFGHLSVVLLTFAVLLNHQFSESVDVKLKTGDEVEFMGSTLALDTIDIEGSENFDSVVARF